MGWGNLGSSERGTGKAEWGAGNGRGEEMAGDELRERTKQFALRVIRLANVGPDLYKEANEILSMVVASIRTARKRK